MSQTQLIGMQIRAVIFDMDGVLLNTEVLYRAAIFASCAAQGHEMVDHIHLSLIGSPKDLGDSKLMAYFGETFDLERYHLVCSQHFGGLCETEVPLRPGVRDLLRVLADAAIPVAVATSTAREKAEAQLKKARIFDNFDVLVTRSDVERGKPHPETFLKAAELLKVDPSNCLVLEDSYNGIRAAKAAGCLPIMVPDLLKATDEMREMCLAIASDLNEVRVLFPLKTT